MRLESVGCIPRFPQNRKKEVVIKLKKKSKNQKKNNAHYKHWKVTGENLVTLFFPAYITCPGSYLCDESESSEVRMCVPMDEVCDGVEQCPLGDDETECGIGIYLLINDTYGVTNGASFLYFSVLP